jgi:protein tyrosine/serine phosphatase
MNTQLTLDNKPIQDYLVKNYTGKNEEHRIKEYLQQTNNTKRKDIKLELKWWLK